MPKPITPRHRDPGGFIAEYKRQLRDLDDVSPDHFTLGELRFLLFAPVYPSVPAMFRMDALHKKYLGSANG